MSIKALTPALLGSVLVLSGCGGGGGGNTPPPTPRPGSVQFETTARVVDEAAGTTTFTVTRTGGSDGAVSVTVARTGTATAGSDYTISSTTVSFAAGDAAPKTLTVTIVDDGDAEDAETLALTLTAPTGGATVGTNAVAELRITDNEASNGLPAAPELAVSSNLKQLAFTWQSVPGATSYRLLEDEGGTDEFTQIGPTIAADATSVTFDVTVFELDWVNARYRLDACSAAGCSASDPISAVSEMVNAIGYVKASNTGNGDDLGFSIALSDDGNTLAVGAKDEDGSATGVNGDQNAAAANGLNSGAVYVFTRDAQAQWSQQAYVKASNTGPGDTFGYSLALSADGSTLAVGAIHEDSKAGGLNGDQGDSNNDTNIDAGAVYVFTRDAQAQWLQQAYVKASNVDANDTFGDSLALSADGNTLAVGAIHEDSITTGVNGNQGNATVTGVDSGAVYVFTRDVQAQWSQQAYVKASNTDAFDLFGFSLALSDDGSTLAVASIGENSSATGVNGSQADDGDVGSGAVYVFTRDEQAQWSQQAYVKASNTGGEDAFGSAVALSGDGNTLAIGAINEDSSATGVGGDQGNSSDVGINSGAVYVFTRDGQAQWAQQAYVKASNTGNGDSFGFALALSVDGGTLAVGARLEDSNAKGVEGDQGQSTDLGVDSGAVYVFTRDEQALWLQDSYVKASNTGANDDFGYSLALSGSGDTLAVGARSEDSNATGIDGDQGDSNNVGVDSGAVYLY